MSTFQRVSWNIFANVFVMSYTISFSANFLSKRSSAALAKPTLPEGWTTIQLALTDC